MVSVNVSSLVYQEQGLWAWKGAIDLLLAEAKGCRVCCFYGDLGSGKTTFIQALCGVLGVREVVRSPTFGLVHEYGCGAEYVYHFDFYRLKGKEEALDIGFEEYLYSGFYCLIEWPEVVESLLPKDCVNVYLGRGMDGGRVVRIGRG